MIRITKKQLREAIHDVFENDIDNIGTETFEEYLNDVTNRCEDFSTENENAWNGQRE